eukprot:2539402-Rhodomonas_salina.1
MSREEGGRDEVWKGQGGDGGEGRVEITRVSTSAGGFRGASGKTAGEGGATRVVQSAKIIRQSRPETARGGSTRGGPRGSGGLERSTSTLGFYAGGSAPAGGERGSGESGERSWRTDAVSAGGSKKRPIKAHSDKRLARPCVHLSLIHISEPTRPRLI